jgi:hypothetical protein
MNNFLTRVVTAIFFGIVFISGIYYNEYTLTGLFAVVLVVCMMEFNKLIFQHAPGQNDHWSVIAGLVLFLTVVLTITFPSLPLSLLSSYTANTTGLFVRSLTS